MIFSFFCGRCGSPNGDLPARQDEGGHGCIRYLQYLPTSPIDKPLIITSITCCLLVGKAEHHSLASVGRSLWRAEGPLLLYRGAAPMLVSTVLYSGTISSPMLVSTVLYSGILSSPMLVSNQHCPLLRYNVLPHARQHCPLLRYILTHAGQHCP